MIYEFSTNLQHWYIDTDIQYVRITDKMTNRCTENYNLGLLGQLEGRRIAAYEGTYAMIGVSGTLHQEHHFIQGDGNRIIWMDDGKRKKK